jgi:thiamine biosynthesis lipoprotein
MLTIPQYFNYLCLSCIYLIGIDISYGEFSITSRMRPLLGTYVEISVESDSRVRADEAIEVGFAAIERVDRLLSSHRADSELNLVNAQAGISPVYVSLWTFQCIENALKISESTRGAFDITCRPILDLWGFVQKDYHWPTPKQIADRKTLTGWRRVIQFKLSTSSRPVSPSDHRYFVGLPRNGMSLDVGGIGKGFAVDRAVEMIQKSGVRSCLVRAGGDLRAWGTHSWKIGVANPSDPATSVRRLSLSHGAISTAGDYENYFEKDGVRYSHIIDPRTGHPTRHRHSVSVRAPTCTLSDAWSTSLFIDPSLKPPIDIEILDQR